MSNQSLSGAVAGFLATLAFIILHQITISNIWFMAPVMLIAGVSCGLCVGWSFSLVVKRFSLRRWLQYNFLYVFMLVLLGVASVIIFDPAMTFASLMALNGPPDQLIAQAMPMTLSFTLFAAVAISLFFERSWKNFGAILLSSAVVVFLLGLNVSAIGLVSIPEGSVYLVAEFLGLIVFINLVYVLCFIGLTKWSFVVTGQGFSSKA